MLGLDATPSSEDLERTYLDRDWLFPVVHGLQVAAAVLALIIWATNSPPCRVKSPVRNRSTIHRPEAPASNPVRTTATETSISNSMKSSHGGTPVRRLLQSDSGAALHAGYISAGGRPRLTACLFTPAPGGVGYAGPHGAADW